MKSKIGLSPLISSILLISISITVVAMISIMSDDLVNESSKQIDSSKKSMNCQSVYVDVKKYDSRDMVCINNNDELNIFLQNTGYTDYYGIRADIFYKDMDVKVLEKYSITSFLAAENKLLKYNISEINISDISEIIIKIGLRDSKKAIYYCALEFPIPGYRLINCSDLYN